MTYEEFQSAVKQVDALVRKLFNGPGDNKAYVLVFTLDNCFEDEINVLMDGPTELIARGLETFMRADVNGLTIRLMHKTFEKDCAQAMTTPFSEKEN